MTDERSPEPARRALAAMLLVGAIALAYVPAFTAGFVWDDDHNLTGHPAMEDPAGWIEIWSGNPVPPWYPVYHSALWLQYRVFGAEAAGYHAVNVLLHALNALLVWSVLGRLRVPGAWVAAGVFGLHPLQVESVAWITELKNVLSGTFALAAVRAWIPRDVDASRPFVPETRARAALAAVAFTAAVLTKTVTVMLPAVLLVLAWWVRGRVSRAELRATAPLAALALAAGLATVAQERALGATGAVWGLGPLERLLLAARAAWFYVGKILWPDPVVFVYPRFTISAEDPVAWLRLAGWGALVVGLFALRRRLGRGPLAAVALYLVVLFPALGFFDVFYARYAQVADRWQYLASLGVTVPVVAGVTLALRSLGAGYLLASASASVVLWAGLGAASHREARHYADAETLWRATIRESPEAFAAHHNLGGLLLARGDAAAAQTHFREAMRLAPDFAEAHNMAGVAAHRLGRPAEATARYREALDLDPPPVLSARIWSNLGISLATSGDPAGAERAFRRAIEADPGSDAEVGARVNLGILLLDRDRPEEAEREFGTLASRGLAGETAFLGLARAARARGDEAAAAAAYREVLAREPASREAVLGLAELEATRDPAEAARLARGALARSDGRDARAWEILAHAQAAGGDREAALGSLAEALKLVRAAGAREWAERLERLMRSWS